LRDSTWCLAPVDKYKNYLWNGPADINFEIHLPNVPPPFTTIPGFSAKDWALSCVDGQIILKYSPFPSPSPYPIQAARINADGHGGEVWAVKEVAGDLPLIIPPALLDEILVVYLLARGWGIMLHTCGIKTILNQGLLFSGISGTGKSTSARLWSSTPGTKLLSDERVIVRKQDGKFWIFGTPWHSDGPSPEVGCAAPLDHLFIIHHAPANQAYRLEPNEALAQLMPQVYLPHGDQAGLDFTLEFLGELVQTVPCFNLGFLPDSSAVAFVQNLIRP
jgi:hypothetical protein